MLGIAQSRDPHRSVFQVFQIPYLLRRFRSRGESEERQPSGGGKTRDLGAARIGLQRHVERGAGVIHRAPDQCLHGDAAAPGINQPDIESFIGEMTACSCHLVGNDAEQLAAKGQQHLTALSMGIRFRDKHDAAGQTCQPLQSDSPSDYFFVAG